MKIDKLNKIKKEEKQISINNLFNILSQVDNVEDIINILIGSLTIKEILILSNRINISKRLIEGETYKKIEVEENVSPTTIKTVVSLLARNNNRLEETLEKYIKKKRETEDNFKFKKGRLYNYPGYELAAKVLGIKLINKYIQKKLQ